MSLEDNETPGYLPAAAFARALQGESVTAQVQWEDRILEFHIDPLRGQAGTIVGTVGVGLDVTEHKRIENAQEFYSAQLRERNEELSRSNQELDDYVGKINRDVFQVDHIPGRYRKLVPRRVASYCTRAVALTWHKWPFGASPNRER